MNMIENYCDAVVRFLKHKEEIHKEVEEMIYSMLEEKYGEKTQYSDEEIADVLKKLGNPNILALKYTNLPNHIVGEKYIYHFYYCYIFLLMIIVVGNLFGFVFGTIEEPHDVIAYFAKFFASCFTGALAGFGALALVFMGIEASKKDIRELGNYNPMSLKKVKKPNPNSGKYKIADSVLGIVFTVFFMLLLNLSPEIIAIYTKSAVIPVLNLEYLREVIWLLNLIYLTGIGIHIFKLASREKTIGKILGFYVIDLLSCVLATIVVANSRFFNPEFLTFLRQADSVNELFIKYGDVLIQRVMMAGIGLAVLGYTIELIVSMTQLLLRREKR